MWLLVAYVFGLRDIFQCASERVALSMSVLDEGYNVAHDESTISLKGLPRPIIGKCFGIHVYAYTDIIHRQPRTY